MLENCHEKRRSGVLSSWPVRDLWCLDAVRFDLNLVAVVPQGDGQSHPPCGELPAGVRADEFDDGVSYGLL